MLEFVQTADGSNTIFNSDIGENYHSRNGALQESKHVFVNAGLLYFLEISKAKEVSIMEVGFGTGLNFLLSADECRKQEVQLNYTGIEAYPLSKEMISQMGYEKYVSADLWQNFITNYSQLQTEYCQLQTAHCQLTEFDTPQQFDIIYYDAFASARQPEMWGEEAIGHTVKFLKPGGVFVTYAITGDLKRMLKAFGFTIQKIPGAAGKREMLRAVKCA